MLVVIGTFIATWIVLGFMCMFFSDYSNLSDAMQNGLVLIIMIIFGWIPCLIVGHDLFEKLERVEE